MQKKGKSIENLYREFYYLVHILQKGELQNFFEDVLTPREMENIHKRILTAFLIEKGYTYDAIRQTLGIGMQKILNVKCALTNGNGGYRLVFERLGQITVKRRAGFSPPSPYPFSHPLSLFGMFHRIERQIKNKTVSSQSRVYYHTLCMVV